MKLSKQSLGELSPLTPRFPRNPIAANPNPEAIFGKPENPATAAADAALYQAAINRELVISREGPGTLANGPNQFISPSLIDLYERDVTQTLLFLPDSLPRQEFLPAIVDAARQQKALEEIQASPLHNLARIINSNLLTQALAVFAAYWAGTQLQKAVKR